MLFRSVFMYFSVVLRWKIDGNSESGVQMGVELMFPPNTEAGERVSEVCWSYGSPTSSCRSTITLGQAPSLPSWLHLIILDNMDALLYSFAVGLACPWFELSLGGPFVGSEQTLGWKSGRAAPKKKSSRTSSTSFHESSWAAHSDSGRTPCYAS